MINQMRVFSSFLIVALTSSLFAVNVTLNVDMSNVTVSENGVHVAGSFQGWDPAATPLTDEDGDGVYSVVVDMSGVTDETVFFKYLNGNSWGTDESVPDLACGGAGGFGNDRFLDVPDAAAQRRLRPPKDVGPGGDESAQGLGSPTARR